MNVGVSAAVLVRKGLIALLGVLLALHQGVVEVPLVLASLDVILGHQLLDLRLDVLGPGGGRSSLASTLLGRG